MSNVTVESIPSPQDVVVEAPAQETASKEKASDKPAAETKTAEKEDNSGASEKSEEVHEDENDEDSELSKDIESKGEDGKPKNKNGFKKRIDKLSKNVSEAKQEAAYWREQALKGQNQPAAKVEEKKEATKSADGKPNVDDFEKHSEYVEALTDWKITEKAKADAEKANQEKRQTESQNLVKTYQEKIAEFKKSAEDFDEAMEDVNHVNMPRHVQQLILESEQGPELTYALAKNPQEFERICKLSPIAAARELGRFESKLNPQTVEKKSEETKTTKAPAPINPVGSKSTSTSQKSPDDMTQAEFNAWRESQKRKRA